MLYHNVEATKHISYNYLLSSERHVSRTYLVELEYFLSTNPLVKTLIFHNGVFHQYTA